MKHTCFQLGKQLFRHNDTIITLSERRHSLRMSLDSEFYLFSKACLSPARMWAPGVRAGLDLRVRSRDLGLGFRRVGGLRPVSGI